METVATYAADTTAHKESDARLQAVHTILDQIQIPPGGLLIRLSHLTNRDRLIRRSLSDEIGRASCRERL